VTSWEVREVSLEVVDGLCRQHHGYGGSGKVAAYSFGVYEGDRLVAAYAWQPPPPGAAKKVCPEAPSGVLALSRMVAVPKDVRSLRHVSKPLRLMRDRLLDRTRWPVLVSYHDEGQGHTGHVYRCSGFELTERTPSRFFVVGGVRVSRYRGGETRVPAGAESGTTVLGRWEHWACSRGEADRWMQAHGWELREIPGKVWRSGAQAHRWVRVGR
jgi:hypothetical protein